MIIEIILILIGFVLLIKGADLFIKASISIAEKFNLSKMLIGLSIVAIGTSLPEIFITITSSLEGYSDLVIGNSVGSCICNLLLVIGITSLIRDVKLDKTTIKIHFTIEIFIILLLLYLGNSNEINRVYGIILILCAIFYVVYTIYEEKKNKELDKELIKEVKDLELKENSIIIIILYIVLGLLGLKFGSDFVVNNATLIANNLGFSESFIGITIIAVGTALPEIITGIISAKKNENELFLGNIVGSNIINLTLLIGIGSVIKPIKYNIEFNFSLIFLILITIVLQMIGIFNKKAKINKTIGNIFILVYFAYIICVK